MQGQGGIQPQVGSVTAIGVEKVIVGDPVAGVQSAVGQALVPHLGHHLVHAGGNALPLVGVVGVDLHRQGLLGGQGLAAGLAGFFCGFAGQGRIPSLRLSAIPQQQPAAHPHGGHQHNPGQNGRQPFAGFLPRFGRFRSCSSFGGFRRFRCRDSVTGGFGVVKATVRADGHAVIQRRLTMFTIHGLTSFLYSGGIPGEICNSLSRKRRDCKKKPRQSMAEL